MNPLGRFTQEGSSSLAVAQTERRSECQPQENSRRRMCTPVVLASASPSHACERAVSRSPIAQLNVASASPSVICAMGSDEMMTRSAKPVHDDGRFAELAEPDVKVDVECLRS